MPGAVDCDPTVAAAAASATGIVVPVQCLGHQSTSVYYTVSQKTITMLHYNYDIHEGILIIFSRYVTKKISN